MEHFSSILKHIEPEFKLTQEEKELFKSVLQLKVVKRKQYIDQPGYVSRYRNYVVSGALRAFFTGNDGEEHTISLAVDDGWIGDAASFLHQQPATLYIEAVEDSTLIQWTYEGEQVLLRNIPQYALIMTLKSQQIATRIQQRVISHLNLSAEERYLEFARAYPHYLQRFPLYVIASYLGMTREFLSKIRNKKHRA